MIRDKVCLLLLDEILHRATSIVVAVAAFDVKVFLFSGHNAQLLFSFFIHLVQKIVVRKSLNMYLLHLVINQPFKFFCIGFFFCRYKIQFSSSFPIHESFNSSSDMF